MGKQIVWTDQAKADIRGIGQPMAIPITSRTDRVYPGEAIVELKGEKRKAMADQLTTVSKHRLRSKLGALSSEDMTRVEAAIAVQLALNLK